MIHLSALILALVVYSVDSFDFLKRDLVDAENDNCDNAVPITLDGQLITGSTENARNDSSAIACYNRENSPSRWYVVVGHGGLMRADTCSEVTTFDTVITVHRGICGELECIGQNDDGCQDIASSITWDAELSIEYYIRVQGFMGGMTGEFGLTVAPVEPAVNDQCEGAITMFLDDKVGVSMLNATGTNETLNCYGSISETELTLWYFIDGSDAFLRVMACASNNTLFGWFGVFEGDDCSNLRCEGSRLDWVAVDAEYRFFAKEGTRYFFLFMAWNPGHDVDSTFDILVTEFEHAANDVCETAIPISTLSNATILGATTHALPYNVSCLDCERRRFQGVWYSLIGTGGAISVSTQSDVLNFDTSLYIFSGTCENKDLIASGVAEIWFGYIASEALFVTELDVEYFILVAGFDEYSVGDFELKVVDVDVPPNMACSDAIELGLDSPIVQGSIFNGTGLSNSDSDYYCSYNDDAPKVWYTLKGTGDVYKISTCSSRLNFYSGIGISNGTCVMQECIAFAAYNEHSCTEALYGAASVTFRTEVGVDYIIFVESEGNITFVGDFSLTISLVDVPPNDACSRALILEPDSGTTYGWISNISTTMEMASYCSSNFETTGVWYSLKGTGEEYVVSTCSKELDFDSGIIVSTGTCGNQVCTVIGSYNDPDCISTSYSAARVVFQTEIGVEYFIYIEGLDYPSKGEFGLTLSTVEVRPKDSCTDAIVIPPNNGTIRGSLSNTTRYLGTNYTCAHSSTNTSSVWYSLVGTGDEFAISTCSRELNFNSALSVSSGSCDHQNCIVRDSSNETDCTLTSFNSARVVFLTEVGMEYFIIVQSQNVTFHQGEFGLSISMVIPPPPDNVEDDDDDDELGDGGETQGNLLAVEPVNRSVDLLSQNVTKQKRSSTEPEQSILTIVCLVLSILMTTFLSWH